MSKPNTDPNTAGSPALNGELRTLQTALFESARARGKLALASWGKSLYLNLLENPAGMWINDHTNLTEAALLAHDEPAYVATIAVTPSGCFAIHLVQMGEFIGDNLPHAGPGDA